MRLKWAIVGCILMAGSAAYAETSKPRNILEFLFGTKKADQPAAIAPSPNSGTSVGAKAAAKAAKQQAIDGEPRRSIRKARSGDGDKRSASAGGSYRGGGHAYCVRTCDGFFFPISHEGAQGGDRYANACQQSCPGAETQVYFMKRGGDIRWASNARGQSYSSLDNALKYRKERDPACSCKSQNQSWGTILSAVEPTIRHHKGDLVVTEDISRRIAQGEDAMAIVKAAEQDGTKQADASTANKRAEATASTPKTLRSGFGDKITPANKFIKIDPEPTGSISTAKPQPAPATTAPTDKRDAKPAKPEAKAPAAKTTAKTAAAPAAKTAQPAVKAVAKAGAKPEKAKAEKAEAKPAKTVLAAAKKATAKTTTQVGDKASADKLALRQTLERLGTTDKRQ